MGIIKQKNPLSNPQFFLILGVFSVILILCSQGYLWYQSAKYSFTSTPAEFINTTQKNIPIHLNIPSIGLSIPIDRGTIVNNVWKVSGQHVTYLNQSASPTEGGNIVLYGHNTKKILGELHNVQIGETIMINTQTNQQYSYIVINRLVVSPDRVDLVSPTQEEVLTLYTCTGLFDSKRLVIQAKPQVKNYLND